MKTATVFLAILTTAWSLISAQDLPEGVVQLPISGFRANQHPNPRINNDPRFRKRSTNGTVPVTLDNQFTFYSTEIELGTPPQKIEILIDTGSSDFWVIASNNPFCSTDPTVIEDGHGVDCNGLTFNNNKSSTFQFNSSGPSDDFTIQYGDGTQAHGYWGTDVLDISGAILKNTSVAVAFQTNATSGIMGISFVGLESTFMYNGDNAAVPNKVKPFTYPNVPVLMVSRGYIAKNAYSLWLNDINAAQGSLLFGGVDHAKYSGTLQTVPIVNTIDGITTPIEMTVILSSLGMVDNSGKSATIMNGNIPALLDSGTSLTYLPSDVVEVIGESLNGTYSDQVGFYVVACNIGGSKGGLVYNFSGAKITVTLEQLMLALIEQDGSPATFSDGTPACALGIAPATGSIILGDTFLRNAYVVYDLDDYEISLANANLDASDSKIEAIQSTVPSASAAPSYSNTAFASSINVNAPTGLRFSDQGTYAGARLTSVKLGSLVTSGSLPTQVYTSIVATDISAPTSSTFVAPTFAVSPSKGGAKNSATSLKFSGACLMVMMMAVGSALLI